MPRKPKEDAKNPRGVYEKKKGSGEWWVLYYDKNGTRHRKKIGPKSLAIDVYRKMKNQIREDEYFPEKKRKRSTVGEAIDRYLEVAADNRSHETDLMHSRLLKDAFKNKVLRDLEAHEIEKWMTKRAADTSPSTANRSLGFLKRVCRKAIRDEYLEFDPTAKVKPFKEPSGRIRFLTPEEEILLRKAVNAKHWPLIEFAILTGLRRGEQFGLKWENVDFANSIITIPRSKHGGTRHIPMNSRVAELLRALPSRMKSEWVFATINGTTPMDAHNVVNRILRPALSRTGLYCAACDKFSEPESKEVRSPEPDPDFCFRCNAELPDPIEDFHWHDLRHTHASRLVMRGVPLYTVQKLLGHLSIRMTERYAHLAPEHLADAVELLVDSGNQQPPVQPPAPMNDETPLGSEVSISA